MTDLTARNYPEILFHLGREIQETGNRMLLFAVPSDEDSSGASDLLSYHVDGIISSAALPKEMVATCAARGVPIVLYNRVPPSASVSAVGCDHQAAMEGLVDHLAKAGLTRPAFVAGPAAAPVSSDRLAGFRAALAQRGLTAPKVVHGDYSYESGRALARSLVAGPKLRTQWSAPTIPWRSVSWTDFASISAFASRRTSPSPDSTTCPRLRGRPTSSRPCASPSAD